MKKIVLVLFALLILVGCASKEKINIDKPQTLNKVTDKFTYETGKCIVSDAYASYVTFNRGEQIDIVNDDGDFYYVDYNGVLLAIDSNYIRTQNDPVFEEYTGYTKKKAKLYSDANCEEEIKSFKLNDEVKVIDKFLDVAIVEVDGEVCYMNVDNISKSKIKEYVVEKQETTSQNNTTGGGNNNPSLEPQDNDGESIDISELAYYSSSKTIKLDTNNVIKARVIVDGTVAYIASYKRDDVVYIYGQEDDNYIVLVDGRFGKIEKKFIRKDCEEYSYDNWKAYVNGSSIAYGEYQKKNVVAKYKTNDRVEVIDEFDKIAIIRLEDGSIGYMNLSDLSKKEIKKVEPKPVEIQNTTPSGGGGNNNPPTEPEQEWSEEHM